MLSFHTCRKKRGRERRVYFNHRSHIKKQLVTMYIRSLEFNNLRKRIFYGVKISLLHLWSPVPVKQHKSNGNLLLVTWPSVYCLHSLSLTHTRIHINIDDNRLIISKRLSSTNSLAQLKSQRIPFCDLVSYKVLCLRILSTK